MTRRRIIGYTLMIIALMKIILIQIPLTDIIRTFEKYTPNDEVPISKPLYIVTSIGVYLFQVFLWGVIGFIGIRMWKVNNKDPRQ